MTNSPWKLWSTLVEDWKSHAEIALKNNHACHCCRRTIICPSPDRKEKSKETVNANTRNSLPYPLSDRYLCDTFMILLWYPPDTSVMPAQYLGLVQRCSPVQAPCERAAEIWRTQIALAFHVRQVPIQLVSLSLHFTSYPLYTYRIPSGNNYTSCLQLYMQSTRQYSFNWLNRTECKSGLERRNVICRSMITYTAASWPHLQARLSW